MKTDKINNQKWYNKEQHIVTDLASNFNATKYHIITSLTKTYYRKIKYTIREITPNISYYIPDFEIYLN